MMSDWDLMAVMHPPCTRLCNSGVRRLSRKENFRKRRLNAVFVEWLMAWPPGHALCDCLETEFILWQQHMRGALSALPLASGAWIWLPTEKPEPPQQWQLF